MKRNIKILLVYPNIPMMLVTPLSIAIFTWILKREGFEVELFDTTQYGDGELSSPQNRIKYLQARNLFSEENLMLLKSTGLENDFEKKIELFKPNLIFYSFTEDSLRRAIQLLRVSNKHKLPTIIGGVLATSSPDWLISMEEIFMLGFGEGEEVVAEVARRISNDQNINDVENLWIKRHDGSIIRNPIRPYIKLDDYSTDFSLFNESRLIRPMGGKIHRALPIETYRGCPNQCTYCNSPMHNRIAKELGRVYIRRRSIDSIEREIAHLVKDYDVNLLYFIDDDFLARPKKELLKFADMYNGFRIPFWFNTRPERCASDILERLKEIGLFRVSFGIESGNEEFRIHHLHRNISNEELLRYFNIIDKSKIKYSINCIIGFPYENRDMVFDTIRFVRSIKGYDAITVSIFTPYRGTILREVAIKEGWLDSHAFTVHTTNTSMINMPHFSTKQIDGLMRTFPLYVEFPEVDWPEIGKAETFERAGEQVFKQYSRMYRERRWGERSDESK